MQDNHEETEWSTKLKPIVLHAINKVIIKIDVQIFTILLAKEKQKTEEVIHSPRAEATKEDQEGVILEKEEAIQNDKEEVIQRKEEANTPEDQEQLEEEIEEEADINHPQAIQAIIIHIAAILIHNLNLDRQSLSLNQVVNNHESHKVRDRCHNNHIMKIKWN